MKCESIHGLWDECLSVVSGGAGDGGVEATMCGRGCDGGYSRVGRREGGGKENSRPAVMPSRCMHDNAEF